MILGWSALAVILVATLSPLGLRPRVAAVGVGIERFGAYALVTAALGFAYPRWRWRLLALVVILAIGLEWLQTLETTRHGRPIDALEKIAGAIAGVGAALLVERMLARCATRRAVSDGSSPAPGEQ